MPHSIHIGASGWSYDDWVGPFYPDGAPKIAYLGHYASEFGIVVVSSLLSPPRPTPFVLTSRPSIRLVVQTELVAASFSLGRLLP